MNCILLGMFGDVARCGLGAPATDTDAVITHRQAAMATAATERKVLLPAFADVGIQGSIRGNGVVGRALWALMFTSLGGLYNNNNNMPVGVCPPEVVIRRLG